MERDKFDNKTVSFEEHIRSEHNMWHYLYFLVLVRVKDPTEYTGPESYVAQMIKVGSLLATSMLYTSLPQHTGSVLHDRRVCVFYHQGTGDAMISQDFIFEPLR